MGGSLCINCGFLGPLNVDTGLQARLVVFLRLLVHSKFVTKLRLYRLAKEDNVNKDVRNYNIGKVKK